jgi:hypothetical protein
MSKINSYTLGILDYKMAVKLDSRKVGG